MRNGQRKSACTAATVASAGWVVYLRRQKCVGRGNYSRVPKERKHAWKAFTSGNVEEKGIHR